MRFSPLLLPIILFVATGATCVPRPPLSAQLPPPVFNNTPTLGELADLLRQNSSRVQTLQSQGARVTVADLAVPLRADIAVERPIRLRLEGRMVGPEFDLGSNEELIWFWAKRDPAKAVYFARHQALAGGQSALPFESEWLAEAFGLVELLPQDHHEGPYPRGANQAEIISVLRRPWGNLQRSLLVDLRYGWILQQRVFDGNGQLLAAVSAANHTYYEEAGISLPHRIDIQLPPLQVNLTIEPSFYAINRQVEDPQERWSMPALEGHRMIDLATTGAAPLGVTEAGLYENRYRSTYRPRYRGAPGDAGEVSRF